MFSLLPALVSILFLSYGFYVVYTIGINRITIPFFMLCITTFAWQATWSFLFQVETPETAITLIAIGWCLILFLPTSLYHFLTEVSLKNDEIPFVYLSYAICIILMILLLSTDWIIDGYYEYFFGFYPKAGILHSIHVLQTSIVVTRGLLLTYKKYRIVQGQMHPKLRYCIIAVLIYFVAAIDYLCNYGVEFYPPGVVFIVVSLGIIAFATAKFHVMDDLHLIAVSTVHDMKTPLATVSMQADVLQENIKKLIDHYQSTRSDVNPKNTINERILLSLENAPNVIDNQIKSIKSSVENLMSIVSIDYLNEKDFHAFGINECIGAALSRIPRCNHEDISITFDPGANDFTLFASRAFLIQVIINIINNAIDAIQHQGKGDITLTIAQEKDKNIVIIRDTGPGISSKNLPHIFDDHFTTKKRGTNSGIGLAFCKTIIKKFKGDISCYSVHGEYTAFVLKFPVYSQCKEKEN